MMMYYNNWRYLLACSSSKFCLPRVKLRSCGVHWVRHSELCLVTFRTLLPQSVQLRVHSISPKLRLSSVLIRWIYLL